MNATSKLVAALALALAVVIGLVASGALSDLLTSADSIGDPVQVAFRPIPSDARPDLELAPRLDAAMDDRRTVVASSPAASAATPDPLGRAAVVAVIVGQDGLVPAGVGLREVNQNGPLGEAFGGTDGSVRLELPARDEKRSISIEAFAEGCVSHAETLGLVAGQTVQLGRIELGPGGVISGRVVDGTGRGVAGALVTSGEVSQRRQQLEMERFLSRDSRLHREVKVPAAVTEVDGSFSLAGLPEGFVRLWASAPGWLSTYTAPVEIRAGQESYGAQIVLVELEPENRIEGIVLDPAGAPVPNADLEYRQDSKAVGFSIVNTTQAESDGTFAFVLPTDSLLSITARDPGQRYGPTSVKDQKTGGDRLVLRLALGREARLVVLGGDGGQLGRFGFEVLAADDDERVFQRGGLESQPDDGAPFRIPGDSFRLRVVAPLHEIGTSGPLDPDAIGESIEVRLTAVPGIPGIVRATSGPVGGARVTLHALAPSGRRLEHSGFRCWLDPTPLDEVETSSAGGFLLSARTPGEFVVRVEKQGFAATDHGPFTVGQDLDAEPLELHLGPGGCIEGRVILPSGEDPTGTLVAVHRGDGHARTTRVGPHGTYAFAQLTSGPWCIETVEGEAAVVYTQTSPASRSFESEVQWNCEVFEGSTTIHDLRLAEPDAFRLTGTVELEGVVIQSLRAWLCPPDADFFDNLGRWSSTSVDPAGHFELGVPEPGEYRLVLKHASLGEEWILYEDIRIIDEVTPWSLKVQTGSLLVEGLDTAAFEDDVPPLVYRWEGSRGQVFLALIGPDEEGVCRLSTVPAGEGALVRPSMESMLDPLSWESALEVEVTAGAENRVQAR